MRFLLALAALLALFCPAAASATSCCDGYTVEMCVEIWHNTSNHSIFFKFPAATPLQRLGWEDGCESCTDSLLFTDFSGSGDWTVKIGLVLYDSVYITPYSGNYGGGWPLYKNPLGTYDYSLGIYPGSDMTHFKNHLQDWFEDGTGFIWDVGTVSPETQVVHEYDGWPLSYMDVLGKGMCGEEGGSAFTQLHLEPESGYDIVTYSPNYGPCRPDCEVEPPKPVLHPAAGTSWGIVKELYK